jgi:hypothetical protein
MRNQRLVGAVFARPDEVVAWFGAVQAQDYRGALWGIAQRTRGATEAEVERALVDRTIVRTWPMRGTLHFVAPDDVRWMLRLLAPRVIARSAARHRELKLDAATFERSQRILIGALEGDRALTRDEAYAALARGKVSPEGQRGIHILGKLAMDGVLCYGAPRGKQQTFVLLDDWIPTSRVLEGDEALGELARRYVTSHGPVTAADLAWWTGLTLTETRRGLEVAQPDLVERTWDGHAYWDAPGSMRARAGSTIRLLPSYDEYTVAYRDRSAILDPALAEETRNGIFSPVIVHDGQIAGTWGRAVTMQRVAVTARLVAQPDAATRALLEHEVERYGRFLALPATLALTVGFTPADRAPVAAAKARRAATRARTVAARRGARS